MKELIKYFEEKYLKGTCFSSLDELMDDRTNVYINGPRALIAVELKGVWRGLKDDRQQEKKEGGK